MTELQIQDNDAGQTLEKYLQKALPALPRSLMFKAVRNKKIKVNRKRCEVRQMLQAGDIVQLFLPPDVLEQETFVPNDRPLRVVWEDDDLMVLYKPRGLLSQKDQPGKQDDMNSRLRTLLWKRGIWNPETDRSFRPSVAHRLDRNTSGIVICGKSVAGLRKMSELLRERTMHKYYQCLVAGQVRNEQSIQGYL
ncbi:pseudouridine synthase, partial [Faecalibaculum rodentium]|uniref:pseudouridine synthase n=1 Tax=Faecalibaculum rodentium TaxID=1702221 RepID=UPI002570C17F